MAWVRASMAARQASRMEVEWDQPQRRRWCWREANWISSWRLMGSRRLMGVGLEVVMLVVGSNVL